MTDPTGALVDAILTATPTDADGKVLRGHDSDGGEVWGDPRPVAARQAAAVLRWLATYADGRGGFITGDGLRWLADQAEADHG